MRLSGVETSRDGETAFIGLTSCDGILTGANDSLRDVLGGEIWDVVARHFAETLWRQPQPALRQKLREALHSARDGARVRFEGTQVAAGGRVRTFDFMVRPLIGANGAASHLVWEARDITDQKVAEEKSRTSALMLALVLDTIPVRVFWKDIDGRYLGCNAAFARDAGVAAPEALLGKSDLELSWQAEAELYRADDRAVISSGSPRVAYEEPQTRPDGTEFWLRTSKIPLRDGEDRVVGVLGVYEDITASKEAEKRRLELEVQMLHAQKLESLGVLAGGIAHDFNNLLVGILGNADLLRPLTQGGAALGHLEALEKAAQRARDLCRQLLAYSGRGRFVVQPVNVSDLARETTQLFALSVSKKASMDLHLDDALPWVQADGTQLRQVLMNLVTNASEALADGEGIIRLRTRAVALGRGVVREEGAADGLAEGMYVVLEVEDTGIGMDERTRARIFEPFFTTKFTGRGLGLAAVLGIVRGHGGAVQVESEVGRGSLFRVFLPAGGARGEPAPQPELAEARLGGEGRILFVDDEPMVLSLGVKMLRCLGFEADTAGDGRKALELYTPGRYVCVILDVTMPQLGGLETMRQLRAKDPAATVILSSGYDAEDVMARMGDLRADGFLEKPFVMETLERTLRNVLSAASTPPAGCT